MAARIHLYKYYLLLGLLVVFTAAVAAYTLSISKDAKHDKLVSQKIVEISSKLDSYIASNSQIPASLDDVGINNVPTDITYAKLTQNQYKVCAAYLGSSGSFDTGLASLFSGTLSRLYTNTSTSNNQGFLDKFSLAYNYKSGQNCQTVKPPDINLSAGLGQSSSAATSTAKEQLLSAKCGGGGANFELKDQTTVTTVNSGQGIISLATTNAKLTDKNSNPVTNLASIKYDPLTTVYQTNCKTGSTADLDNLKPGASITIYLYSDDGTYADQVDL